MNCFVIMPFSPEFDDVYAAIKIGVEAALSTRAGTCYRLDEARPAGRITDRLLAELRTASVCVADLTGNKPNVMWEVGFAMALEKPVIVITQSQNELPFDLRDMQSLQYDRTHLNGTLTKPLQRMILDTVAADQGTRSKSSSTGAQDEVISELRGQVSELKNIVLQAVRSWSPPEVSNATEKRDADKGIRVLEGAWVSRESGSHLYAEVIDGELVVPYCFAGNYQLVGVYYGWKRVGDHWFGRFMWLNREKNISGFAFLKPESVDRMVGAWWYDDDGMRAPSGPPSMAGVAATWERRDDLTRPSWATKFIEEVRTEGLTARLTRA
jgi:hypothetical protein